MALKMKASSLVLLLVLIICSASSSIGEGVNDYYTKSSYVLHKDDTQVNWRKLLGHDQVMDYDYTGPNPKHDPRKGKPGKAP